MPVRSGLTTRKPTSGVGSPSDRLGQLEASIENLSARLSKLQGPGLRPQGPTSVEVAPVGTTHLISFRADVAEASGVAYRIWRASAGTRSAPITPSSSTATLIGAIPAIWSRPSGAEPYIWADRDFEIVNLDPADPARFSYWVSTATIEEESPKVLAAGSPIEVRQNGPGDQSAEEKFSPFNKLANANFDSAATAANLPLGRNAAVTGATNATPIVITTAVNHNLTTGDLVQVRNVGGNNAANGLWQVTVTSPTQFSLNGTVGSGVYTAGGEVYPRKGQPLPPDASSVGGGNFEWSPWYADTPVIPEFVSDGAFGTGEIVLKGVTWPEVCDLLQVVTSNKFRRGLHMTLSVFVRAPVAPNDMQVRLFIIRPSLSQDFGTYDGSLITTDYRRLVFNFTMNETLNIDEDVYFIFRAELKTAGGTPRDIFIFKPMLGIGDTPPGWTSLVDQAPQPGVTTTVDDTQTPAWSREPKSTTKRAPNISFV